MYRNNGPIGFTDMDHEGMLVEGFNEFNMSITFYNYPYYLTHMERLGLKKDIDWIEYKLSVPKEIDPRFIRISEHLVKKGNYKAVTSKPLSMAMALSYAPLLVLLGLFKI